MFNDMLGTLIRLVRRRNCPCLGGPESVPLDMAEPYQIVSCVPTVNSMGRERNRRVIGPLRLNLAQPQPLPTTFLNLALLADQIIAKPQVKLLLDQGNNHNLELETFYVW